MNANAPCKGCEAPVRHVGCHSECEKYLNWRKSYDEKKSVIEAQKKLERDVNDYKTTAVIRREHRLKSGSYRRKR